MIARSTVNSPSRNAGNRRYESAELPNAVRLDLLAGNAPHVVRSWAGDLPGWVEIRKPERWMRDGPRWLALDPGEQAALVLSSAYRPSLLLIEERPGS